MFQEVEREKSFVSWLLQLLAAYCGPVVLLVLIETWINARWDTFAQDTSATDAFAYLFSAVAASALAFVVALVASDSPNEGRWVFTLPTTLVLGGMAWEWSSHGIASAMAVLHPNSSEEGWTLVFLTIPAWSCWWYSTAMWWLRRRRCDTQ
jgi:hypothetical protein